MMETKLFSEFFKIPTGRISNIGPDNIAFDLAQFADVSSNAVLGKFSGVTV
jgi:hypothetical protein